MEKARFEIADNYADEIAEEVARLLEGAEFETVRGKLQAMSKDLGDDYSVSLSAELHVFDGKKERSMIVLRTGLSTSSGQEPYLAWGDSSPQKYVVDGEMVVVPDDHCPSCWGSWGFKDRNHSCQECGATLGTEVKILLDTNVCPHCEKGSVSPTILKCIDCGYEVNPAHVVWG